VGSTVHEGVPRQSPVIELPVVSTHVVVRVGVGSELHLTRFFVLRTSVLAVIPTCSFGSAVFPLTMYLRVSGC